MKAVSGQRSVVSGLCKVVCVSLLFIFYFSIFNSATAQSGLYIPSSKPVKNMQKALANAETFCLLISYQGADSAYGISDLDLLDSAYRIAFSLNNPNYYTMSVEGYGDADTALSAKRVESVRNYFAKRCHAPFPIRMALNPIRCSCHGDTVETVRYEVPLTTAVYNIVTLPEARKVLNKSVSLKNSVLVTFHNNPDECLGAARGCYLPTEDSTVRGYYASLMLPKGSVHTIENTKDSCNGDLEIRVDDHLDYKATVERYRLIPHSKQLLIQAGYIVLSSNQARGIEECELPQESNIILRIPVTKEQIDARLKFFAKVKTAKGVEYKALPTRRTPGKGELSLQASVSISQFDTIYLGKRINEKEIGDYFYEVESLTEAASFAIGKKYYVAFRVDKHGKYELKKPLRAMFRIVADQEEETPAEKEKREGKNRNPDEIIED